MITIISMALFFLLCVYCYKMIALSQLNVSPEIALDKKKHLKVSYRCVLSLSLSLFILGFFYLDDPNNAWLAYPITMVLAILSFYLWEYLPVWFPKIFPNRNCDKEDIAYGFKGLFLALPISVILAIIFLLIMQLTK